LRILRVGVIHKYSFYFQLLTRLPAQQQMGQPAKTVDPDPARAARHTTIPAALRACFEIGRVACGEGFCLWRPPNFKTGSKKAALEVFTLEPVWPVSNRALRKS
jgi:hypothetical protein